MTKYSELPKEEQKELHQELMYEAAYIVKGVQEDYICAICLMNWYNCLCSHQDE